MRLIRSKAGQPSPPPGQSASTVIPEASGPASATAADGAGEPAGTGASEDAGSSAVAVPGAADPSPARRIDDLTVHPDGRRIGELIVGYQLASREQVVEALVQQENSQKRLGTLLVELGALDERNLASLIAHMNGLSFVDLRQHTPDPAAVALLPEATARALSVIPVSCTPEAVIIAVTEPSVDLVHRLEAEVQRPVRLLVGADTEIAHAIGTNYRAISGIDAQIEAFEARDAVRRAATRLEAAAAANDDAPVVQVVQLVITQGLRDRASDIHVEPQDDRVRVRFRIDGALHDVLSLPGSMGPAIVSRIKIMGGMNIVERRRAQDGQIAMELEGRQVDIRVSTALTIWGEKVVMRLLDKSRRMLRLPDLGMPADTAAMYSEIIRAPYGMVVCAGPTGSGKTTTLYGTLTELNQPDRNIMTIEDPVEYVFPSINQIQIHDQAGITFAGGLRSILRQDPDIILVGEVRDVETARIAVQSALTGHFVLSSLHATDAVAALHRLLDMGIEPFLVAASVTAVVAQRLVRRICNYCREEYEPSAQELALLRESLGRDPLRPLHRGGGCSFCSQTGYLERIGVYELLLITEEIKELVLRQAPHSELRAAARRQGMRTLRDEAVALTEARVTTAAEVMRSIYVMGS